MPICDACRRMSDYLLAAAQPQLSPEGSIAARVGAHAAWLGHTRCMSVCAAALSGAGDLDEILHELWD